MKKHLLVAASALVVGLGFSGAVYAQDQSAQFGDAGVAVSIQLGTVVFDRASGTVGSNSMDGTSATGLVNVQQNAGANSEIQDDNTVAAILSGQNSGQSAVSGGGTAGSIQGFDHALALSAQVAVVAGDSSHGAHAILAQSKGGGEQSSFVEACFCIAASESHHGGGNDSGGGGGGSSSFFAGAEFAAGEQSAGWHDNTWDSFYQGSSNSITGSIGGTGLINVSQNVGNNSVLQAANTVGAVISGQK